MNVEHTPTAAELEELFDLDLAVVPAAERLLPEASSYDTCGTCVTCAFTCAWTCGGITGRPCAC
jgi:hypothetical protein